VGTADSGRVVGVFPTYARAEAAHQDLRRRGIAEEAIRIGRPKPGRYRIETREFEDMGRGAMLGVMIGVPVGALVAVGVLMALVPGFAGRGIAGIVLGLVTGAFWGIFFGGLAGVVPRVLAHEKAKHHHDFAADCDEAVVSVSRPANLDAAYKVMQRAGASCILSREPELQAEDMAAAA
jgi:hypothetical protein